MNRIKNYERMYLGENLKMPNKASRIDALWQAILNKKELPFKPVTRAEKELAKKLVSSKAEPVVNHANSNSEKINETE